MPIYDFICQSCGSHFDKLTSFDWKKAGVACPTCDSKELTQAISLIGGFQSGGKMQATGSNAGCTTCHSSSCSTCH